MSAYHFRPLTCADLTMVARWLETPEVLRWWGDPKEQIVLITEDLDQPLMRQWIVEHQSRAFAYLQAYPANAWPQRHLTHLPNGAVVIDAFIGEPAMLGCGHGSAFLRVVGEKLLAEGAPIVAIDPDRDNHRARRAYTRAGFVEENIVQAANGPLLLCFCHSGITPDLCSDLDETVDLMADRLQKSFPRPQRDARCYSFI